MEQRHLDEHSIHTSHRWRRSSFMVHGCHVCRYRLLINLDQSVITHYLGVLMIRLFIAIISTVRVITACMCACVCIYMTVCYMFHSHSSSLWMEPRTGTVACSVCDDTIPCVNNYLTFGAISGSASVANQTVTTISLTQVFPIEGRQS